MYNTSELLRQADYQAARARETINALLSFQSATDLFITFNTEGYDLETFDVPVSEFETWVQIFTALETYYTKRKQYLRLLVQAGNN
jgi:hypothetical protein